MEGSKIYAPVRATRYTVAMPLKYRRVGEPDWHDGMAENISQSGLLFRGDRSLSEEEVIEINFTLRGPGTPAENAHPCTAIVVRKDRSRVENRAAFGMRFLD